MGHTDVSADALALAKVLDRTEAGRVKFERTNLDTLRS